MYLLNPEIESDIKMLRALHSTMYLLNQVFEAGTVILPGDFTFHNVSIKSGGVIGKKKIDTALHSTMYLLNHEAAREGLRMAFFTFHNVSIKSRPLQPL